jgi:hypothetical protein
MKPMRALLFISLVCGSFWLMSCEKPGLTPGDNLLPGGDALTAFQTDTFTIVAQTMIEDSVQTDELSLAVLGRMEDPVLGATECQIFTEFKLSALDPGFPSTMEIDSVVLALAFNTTFYGHPNRQQFAVYPLTEGLILDSHYYANSSLSYAADNWIEPGFDYLDVDPNKDAIVAGDTTFPQLRIRLKNEVGTLLTQPSDVSVLSTQDNFQQYFKGLCITAKARMDAIMRYDLVDPGTKLTVYYRDLSGTTPDTLLYDFVVGTDCARFNRFKQNYAGTELQNIAQQPLDGSQHFYVQSGGGLKAKIQLPTIGKLSEGNKVIAQAELQIPVELDGRFTAFDQLFLRYIDENGEQRILPDESAQSIGGFLNTTTEKYSFVITRYIQSVLTGEINSKGLYLLGGTTGVSAKRIIAHGPQFNPAQPSENTRLIVTFAQ